MPALHELGVNKWLQQGGTLYQTYEKNGTISKVSARALHACGLWTSSIAAKATGMVEDSDSTSQMNAQKQMEMLHSCATLIATLRRHWTTKEMTSRTDRGLKCDIRVYLSIFQTLSSYTSAR